MLEIFVSQSGLSFSQPKFHIIWTFPNAIEMIFNIRMQNQLYFKVKEQCMFCFESKATIKPENPLWKVY